MTTQCKDQITAAIGAHGMWKARLLSAIDTGKSDFTPATIAVDDRCDFGKWLHGTIDASLKAMPDYAEVKQHHAAFHKEASKVLSLALAGKKDEAKQQLQGDYARISSKLVTALAAWKSK